MCLPPAPTQALFASADCSPIIHPAFEQRPSKLPFYDNAYDVCNVTDFVGRRLMRIMNVYSIFLFIPEINKNSEQLNSITPPSKNPPVFLKSQGWQV